MTLPESSSSIDTYSDSAGDHENLPPPFNNSVHSNTFQQTTTTTTTIKQPVKPIKSLEQPLPPRTQNFPDTQLQKRIKIEKNKDYMCVAKFFCFN